MKAFYRFSGEVADYKGDPKSKEAKALLGGKGAGLTMMAQQGLNVPPGFTIPTTSCLTYMSLQPSEKDVFMDALMDEVMKHMGWLGQQFGYYPLVSVRSGAPVSMPGMMDTILNVGLTDETYHDWEQRLGLRAAADSHRRLVQMLGSTGYGVPMEVFDFQLAKVKKEAGKTADTDLTAAQLSKAALAMTQAFKQNKGVEFPFNDAALQLRVAIRAVFDSWMNPRAIEYRKLNGISEDMGTAVNVQAMVFGNMGDDSGTGVLFSRDPSTGEPGMMGEFLTNAQGEDVVAGIRTPRNVATMDDMPQPHREMWQVIHAEITELCAKLELAYRDMVDIEFTVQKGTLFVLQSRTGKRSARAAFKIATDMVEAGEIEKAEALKRLTPDQFKTVRRPTIDPKFKNPPNLVGLPACPGVVTGRPVFSSADAVAATDAVILVTHETDPDDIAGMAKAIGILTQTGGATSHAAVVARAMDKPCIVGCTDMEIDALHKFKKITIDGATGKVWFDQDVPVIDSSDDPAVKTVMGWCMSILGAQEPSPVDLGVDHPHRITAALWWGSMEALDAVLAGIEELPYRSHVALDLTPPSALIGVTDVKLIEAFGDFNEDGFAFTIVQELLARASKLKGMPVLNPPHEVKPDLHLCGFHVGPNDSHSVPVALPPDFATFTVLGA